MKQASATLQTMHSPVSGRPDTRTAITFWALLVWAYKNEQVRFAGVSAARGFDLATYCATQSVSAALRAGIVGRGGNGAVINGKPSAHHDADVVEALVSDLDREVQWAVIRSAEAGVMPVWDVPRRPLKVVPVLNVRGQPKMLYQPPRKEPIACLAQVVGTSEADHRLAVAEARCAYFDWYTALYRMRERLLEGDTLMRWTVTSIGAEPEPWQPSPHSHAAQVS